MPKFGRSTVVAAKASIATVNDYVTQINESLPELLSLADLILIDLVNSDAERSSIATAARQVTLVRSIEHSLNQIQNNGEMVMATQAMTDEQIENYADSLGVEIRIVEPGEEREEEMRDMLLVVYE